MAVERVDLHTRLDEDRLDHRQVAAPSGHVQRRLTRHVDRVDVGTTLEKLSDDVGGGTRGSEVEGGPIGAVERHVQALR